MEQVAFEAEVMREGYATRTASIEPGEHRPAHSHPFDARLLILDGALTLGFGEKVVTYGPGETCFVAAGTVHDERGGSEGARYVAARRAAP